MSVVGSARVDSWVCAGAGAIQNKPRARAKMSRVIPLLGPEFSRIRNKRVADRAGLLGDHGMGRVRNDHDGDADTQRTLVFLGVLHMGQRVVAWLDVQDR